MTNYLQLLCLLKFVDVKGRFSGAWINLNAINKDAQGVLYFLGIIRSQVRERRLGPKINSVVISTKLFRIGFGSRSLFTDSCNLIRTESSLSSLSPLSLTSPPSSEQSLCGILDKQGNSESFLAQPFRSHKTKRR